MQNTEANLQESLKQFGLNPLDWWLKKIKKGTYLVINRDDKSFQLAGTANTQGWQKLQLFSL